MTSEARRRIMTYSDGPDLPSEYWKLRSSGTKNELIEDMEGRGFPCREKGPSSKDRALKLDLRSQRSLLSYETLSKAELRSFCDQRGLVIRGNPRDYVLKKLLEEADDNATFERFAKLPSELRLYIFQLYFKSLASQTLTVATRQPPVSLASSLFRHEALPIFYQQVLFRIDLVFQSDPTGAPASQSACELSQATRKFLEDLYDTTIGNMWRLEVRFMPTSQWRPVAYTAKVDLNTGVPSFRTTAYGTPHNVLEASITEVFEGIIARQGPRKLRKNDFRALCDAVDRASANPTGSSS